MHPSTSSSTAHPSHSHNHHNPQPQIPITRIKSAIKNSKTCPICLSHISGHRPAVITTCMHAYCLTCLLRWSNQKRTCPLCNSPFHSYFSTFSSSSTTFRVHRLLPLRPPSPRRESAVPLPIAAQRVLRRRRAEVNAGNRRSKPVPRRRSFGRLDSVPAEVVQERVLQWRASIYQRSLQAVPVTNGNSNLSMKINEAQRDSILRKIEPWIRRELHAVLQDPDPMVIVHVATSAYLSSLENKHISLSRCAEIEDTLLSPLRPFLHEWTNLFWHELRCFAESSFTMDTYDEVVDYRKLE